MPELAPALAYINNYWPHIIRHHPEDEKTRIGLPHPYAVPSDGSMFQEMYYWDSYFIALGLVGTPHEAVIIDMAENLAYCSPALASFRMPAVTISFHAASRLCLPR